MKLTTENVNNVFMACLFNENEKTDNHIIGEAIKIKIGFHPERLEMAKKDIESMLDCLPIRKISSFNLF